MAKWPFYLYLIVLIWFFPKMTFWDRIAQLNEHVHNIFPCSYIHGAFAVSTAPLDGLANSIVRRVNYSAGGEIRNYETACWFDTLKMLTCFYMNMRTNASSEIQGSKNIEGLSLRYPTDVKINTYITECRIGNPSNLNSKEDGRDFELQFLEIEKLANMVYALQRIQFC